MCIFKKRCVVKLIVKRGGGVEYNEEFLGFLKALRRLRGKFVITQKGKLRTKVGCKSPIVAVANTHKGPRYRNCDVGAAGKALGLRGSLITQIVDLVDDADKSNPYFYIKPVRTKIFAMVGLRI